MMLDIHDPVGDSRTYHVPICHDTFAELEGHDRYPISGMEELEITMKMMEIDWESLDYE